MTWRRLGEICVKDYRKKNAEYPGDYMMRIVGKWLREWEILIYTVLSAFLLVFTNMNSI